MVERFCSLDRVDLSSTSVRALARGRLLGIQLLPRQRAVGEWLLRIVGAREHLIPHPPEHEVDLDAERFQIGEPRPGERAVIAVAVGRVRSRGSAGRARGPVQGKKAGRLSGGRAPLPAFNPLVDLVCALR
jgi:hypothetical protein